MQCLNTKSDNIAYLGQGNRPLRLAQLTDLHLTGKIGKDNSYRQFLACLDLMMTTCPDFLLLTGDLVNHGDHNKLDKYNKDGYDWLFKTLSDTCLPFACLAGNHDVSVEFGSGLPYHQRRLLPAPKDERLLDRCIIPFAHWQLLCLNSAVSGKEFGQLTQDSLDWLNHALHAQPKPTIIALHHHPLLVGSAWIDTLALDNRQALLKTLAPHAHVKAILSGHVHQAHALHHKTPHGAITFLTTPATSRQFLPFSPTFALDDKAAGGRLLCLCPDGQLNSQVLRLG